uniref:Peptide-N-glycosidase F N-terminal domain-containing protein n=1 Tax=Uncultured bacterium HF130_AEPn_1 TaxID=663362 RepID=D0E8J7_UNCHF|nr:hypothetical protein ALOHA_HF130_AEPn_1_18c [uncultured bacterium HF130_AEPn_1]
MKFIITILATSLLIFSCGDKSNESSKSTGNGTGNQSTGTATAAGGTTAGGASGTSGAAGSTAGATASGGTGSTSAGTGTTGSTAGGTGTSKPPENTKFSKGPYGIGVKDILGEWTVATLDGDFEFKKHFDGSESYFFVMYAGTHNYSKALWGSSFANFIKATPKNVRLFLLSYNSTFKKDLEDQKKRFLNDIKSLDQKTQDHFKERVHFVVEDARKIKGALGDVIRKRPGLFFGLDRNQRIRELGSLSYMNSPPAFQWMAKEAEFFNFEIEREKKLNTKAKIVKAMDNFIHKGGWGSTHSSTFDVELPAKNDIEKYDTLLVDFDMSCEDHLDKNCPDWDHTARLFLCRKDDEKKCDLEVARWITTYKREGRWVTDISPVLALFGEGGKRKFRYTSPNKNSLVLNFRFSNEGKGMRPVAFQEIFKGGSFNQEYNKKQKQLTFKNDGSFKKVETYAILTGHGWGKDVDNCAEFCNHVHFITLNSKEKFMREHKIAGQTYGCMNQVNNGVVPNQYGTWILGRGGWCPGMDVLPWREDLTKALVSGENTLDYKALFKGTDYTPVPHPNANKQGLNASISLNSYLIFWK